ncbi:MAG: class I SAM-dependent methyltransferase [Planctomycetota bacterium]
MSSPSTVEAAFARAKARGFEMSSDPVVGQLLAVLAGAVPKGGKILELGTGCGAGLAWLVHGLGGRTDVEVVTVDTDSALIEETKAADWPDYVRFELGDGGQLVRALGQFDLIFPDAPGGKLTGIESTIQALRPNGVMVLDDMNMDLHEGEDDLIAALQAMRKIVLARTDLRCVELRDGSGVLLASRIG